VKPQELLARLYELGGRASLEGGTVRIRARRGALPDELWSELKERRDEIHQLLKGLRETAPVPPLLPQRRPSPLPVSYAQQRLWFIDRLEGGSTEYNAPEALRLRGALDHAALTRAIDTIVARHESLRTHFADIDGTPVQVIAPAIRIDVPVDDLRGLREDDQRERTQAALRREWETRFDLSRGPLLRARLLRLGDEDHILVRTVHHIVSDGWSQGVFNRELMDLYVAFREGREHPLPPLPVQYADFALWQRQWLAGGALNEGLAYWTQQLAGIPEQLVLPMDRPRPAVRTSTAATYTRLLPADVGAVVKAATQAQQATLYMTLLAAFGILLSRYSGQDDIVVGSPIANRRDAQVEGLIGFFVNSLVMRLRIPLDRTFGDWMRETRHLTLEAYRYQDVPFERLVEELAPQRRLDVTPVFQVLFLLQNAPWTAPAFRGLDVEAVRIETRLVPFDLEVHAFEYEGRIACSWIYNRDLFDPWRIEQLARHFERVLAEGCANPDLRASEIPLLDAAERRQVLTMWNDTARDVPETLPLALFEAQAARTPDAVAVTDDGRSMTYAALNACANRLAAVLADAGAGPEVAVGLCLERSAEMIVALLAVLKTGAAYLPLDPTYPADRLAFMLEDAQAPLLVVHEPTRAVLPADAARRTIDLDADAAAVAARPDANPPARSRPDHILYYIYTSGSTGRPKGTRLSHRALGNLLHWHLATLVNGAPTLQFASLSFDASFHEIFAALATGGVLHVLPHADRLDVERLAAYIGRHAIAKAILPVALFKQLAAMDTVPLASFRTLRELMITGDRLTLTPAILAWCRELTACALHNHYGPSETHVVTAFTFDGPPVDLQPPPIGRPIANTQIHILDACLNPVPPGVVGELFIGGANLARDYHRRPGLTASRFVAHPYGAPGARMYRTGDLARWRADGDIEFIGRTDHQIKIRGFRVEPGEIETALRAYPAVADALVIAADGPTEKRLIAYVVRAAGHDADPHVLREALAQQLPAHMVPARIVVLDAWPLTPTEKIDRQALPVPDLAPVPEGRAPRTPAEQILCGVFAEVLGRDAVSIDEDFFELGGHSLLATPVVSRVRAIFGVEIAVRTLFEAPRVVDLAQRLGQAPAGRPPLVARERPARIPLSYAQQRLWFLDRLEGGSTEYHLPEALRLRGTLDRAALTRAINAIVARHESLRTHFTEIDGAPVQTIEPDVRIAVPVDDLRGLDAAKQWTRVQDALRFEWEDPFDLSRGPLLRLRLLQIDADDHVLVQTLHHIVSDGWSQSVFNRELMELYAAFREDREDPLPPLSVQYADFAIWQRQWLDEGALDEGLTYWTTHLAGIPERLALPADRPRPERQTFVADRCHLLLPPTELAALKKVSQQHQATLYMTVLAAFGVLLSRYSGQDDIVVGSPIANRQDTALEALIGFFVNSLVLRMRVRPDARFADLLEAVRQTTLEAYRYQDVPFERVVEALAPPRSLNTSPLFQVNFALQNAPVTPPHLAKLGLEPLPADELRVHFDLEVHAWEHQGRLDFSWAYNRDLFDRWRMEQMARHYRRVMCAVAADPTAPLAAIPLLDPDERQQILVGWNATACALPADTIPALVDAQAARTSDAVAAVADGACVTYAALNARANQLAHLLRARGVGPDRVVGVCLERSLDLVVALLATLKAGAAYLPLEPAQPAARLAFMRRDASADVCLTWRRFARMLDLTNDEAICLDEIAPDLARQRVDAPTIGLNDEHLAYVMYTSGSTGAPKGVMSTHGGLINRLQWMQREYILDVSDRVLQKTPFGFDVSVWEFFWPLIAGATLVVAAPDGHKDPAYLARTIAREQITTLHFVPSMLERFLDDDGIRGGSRDGRTLRRVFSSGEALSASLPPRLHARLSADLHNLYGPTEAAIDVTCWPCARDAAHGPVPIGRPIANTRVYVLDARLEPVPVGVAGELYLAGVALARGYVSAAAQTSERFIADPHGGPGARMYRTGDLVRWRPDGAVEFLGRVDDQLKIRGVRIEPGEVEAALRRHPGVSQAVVIARQDRDGDPRLVAYIVAESGHDVDLDVLRKRLGERLPDAMVPSVVMPLDALPLTANGKVDRRALPAPEVTSRQAYRAPRTPDEQTMCGLFEDVLGVSRVGVDDDFFELGGHSLLATRLVSRIHAAFGVDLPLRTLFTATTVRDVCAMVDFSRHARREPVGPAPDLEETYL